MDVFAVALDIDQVFAGYDWKIINGEHAVMNLLLDDVRLRRTFDWHLRIGCRNNQSFSQSLNLQNRVKPILYREQPSKM